MSETNYFRLIEAYFEGSITPTDKAMLEAKIKSDPLLKAEFDLQKNIVKGISNVRKMELKSRLAAIDIPTSTGILSGGGAKWLAGTVAGVTLFGSMLYWSLISIDNGIVPVDIKSEDQISFDVVAIAEFPEIETESSKETLENFKTVAVEKKEEKESTKLVEDVAKPAKIQPQSLMSFEDDEFFNNQENHELKNISSREVAHNRADKTEIEFLDAISDEKTYHYRYYNSKLYLYGDFKKMPYEIIELNDKGSKQLFLSHNNEVYLIKDNTTVTTELKEIEDDMLKMEIQLIANE